MQIYANQPSPTETEIFGVSLSNLHVCVCTHMCVECVCTRVYVCVVELGGLCCVRTREHSCSCRYEYTCECAFVSQRTTSDAISQALHPCFLRQGLSLTGDCPLG